MKKNRSKETTKREKPKTTDIETEKQRVLRMNDFLVADEQSMFEAKVKEKRETFHDDDDFASSNKPFFSLNLGKRKEETRVKTGVTLTQQTVEPTEVMERRLSISSKERSLSLVFIEVDSCPWFASLPASSQAPSLIPHSLPSLLLMKRGNNTRDEDEEKRRGGGRSTTIVCMEKRVSRGVRGSKQFIF